MEEILHCLKKPKPLTLNPKPQRSVHITVPEAGLANAPQNEAARIQGSQSQFINLLCRRESGGVDSCNKPCIIQSPNLTL